MEVRPLLYIALKFQVRDAESTNQTQAFALASAPTKFRSAA
jgi:hypothetical protein